MTKVKLNTTGRIKAVRVVTPGGPGEQSKSENAPRQADSAQAQARQAVEQARNQTEQVRSELDQARAQADLIRQQATEEMQALRDELAQTRSALESGLEQLGELREQILVEAESQLLDLALDIARKVLCQEIKAGRYDIQPIVEEALAKMPSRRDVVVHLSPEDWAHLEMAHEGNAIPGGNVRFKADPSVKRAECILETGEGVVDASIDEQLDEISDALKEQE